jgi:membrane-associated phospholipid phosphatase
MTAAVAAIGNRYLPRGWRDFGRQLAIWFGFLLLYQVVRGIADRNPTRAFENGLRVIDVEERVTGLFELSLQKLIASSEFLTAAVSWTYWQSEFTVVGLTLLWVYIRRNEHFYRFRNWILLANAIGLVGYVIAPTAPPRMFGVFGFEDTLLDFGALNHGSGLIELASNPYAAMPSLHAADALIVGVSMALIVRSRFVKILWIAWPAWVWFAVMATANHFWLDIAAGVLVALLTGAIMYRKELRRVFTRRRDRPEPQTT